MAYEVHSAARPTISLVSTGDIREADILDIHELYKYLGQETLALGARADTNQQDGTTPEPVRALEG